jgi:CrcB protein
MGRFLLVCLGGAIGTGARYALSTWCRDLFGPAFPAGTLAVNVIGSFLLVVIMYVGLNSEIIAPTTRIVLGTGVMGGFTTYSSFNYETLQLLRDRDYRMGALNLLLTLLGCFAAGLVGLAVGRRIVGS